MLRETFLKKRKNKKNCKEFEPPIRYNAGSELSDYVALSFHNDPGLFCASEWQNFVPESVLESCGLSEGNDVVHMNIMINMFCCMQY